MQISQTYVPNPYKDVLRRTFPNNANNYVAKNQSKLPPPPKRLALESPPSNLVVVYFEAKQVDFISSEEDFAILF